MTFVEEILGLKSFFCGLRRRYSQKCPYCKHVSFSLSLLYWPPRSVSHTGAQQCLTVNQLTVCMCVDICVCRACLALSLASWTDMKLIAQPLANCNVNHFPSVTVFSKIKNKNVCEHVSTCVTVRFLVLYLSISIFYYFLLLLHYNSGANVVLFTLLNLFYNFSY